MHTTWLNAYAVTQLPFSPAFEERSSGFGRDFIFNYISDSSSKYTSGLKKTLIVKFLIQYVTVGK